MPNRKTRGAGARTHRRTNPEVYPTLTIAARALYDRAAPVLKARGRTLRTRAERNELALVCWILAKVATYSRMVADKSPLVHRKDWKISFEGMLWRATVIMSRRGWVDGKGHPGELEELFGIGRLLPHLRKQRGPRPPSGAPAGTRRGIPKGPYAPAPPGGKAA